MIRGLQVGFGALIGADLLTQLRDRGVQMARIDCQTCAHERDMRALIEEVIDADITPLVIIRVDQALWVPSDLGCLDIEISNEPDLGTSPTGRQTPMEYAMDVQRVAAMLGGVHRLWAGAVSNLNQKALQWLRESVLYWPEGVGVSVHRYPPTGAGPAVAHRGYEQRENEVAELMTTIGGRRWGVSEVGYHTAEWFTGWWFWRHAHRLTDQQVAEYTAWEVRFWESQGAAFFISYQINDGPGKHYNDHFGWRTLDGSWKPVADVYAGGNVIQGA